MTTRTAILSLWMSLAAPAALAQSTVYTLDDAGWAETPAETLDESSRQIADARRALAEGRPGAARSILDDFIRRYEAQGHRLLPQAYRLRGDAKVALRDEFEALYDYEAVVRSFPASEEMVVAVEREYEIARAYAAGKRKKFLGMRIEPADDIAIEIFMRTQERLPGSAIAEQASISLADYYFNRRDWEFASEAYELYLLNYPQGPNALKAQKRRIYSEIAGYAGPARDSRPLIEAREQIRRFERLYPAEAAQTGLDAALIERVDETLAQQMLATANWYLRIKDPPSARLTLRRLIAKYPTSDAARSGMAIMDARGWPYELASQGEGPSSAETPSEEESDDAPPGVNQ